MAFSAKGLLMFFNRFILFSFLLAHPCVGFEGTITVGSKRFTENLIIGEIFAQLLEDRGFTVKRKLGLGGTMVAFNAIKEKEIDVYPEYTGTITKILIESKNNSLEFIKKELSKKNIKLLPPLGFENTYCLIMKENLAQKLGIKTISDLSRFPNLKGGLSFEFQARGDGWNQLKKFYSLKNKVRGIEIPLTYEAVKNNKVDFAEAYSTEPMIKKLNFTILEDDRHFFPKYEALALFHNNFPEKARNILKLLSHRISNDTIMKLNSMAVSGVGIQQIANRFLVTNNFITQKTQTKSSDFWIRTYTRTKTHLFLTSFAVLLATLVAFPFAFFSAGNPKMSKLILGLTGIFQTIPSIALLAFMIPLFGIGHKPAIVGLFIYSLLPILRNTYTAINQIDPRLIMVAKSIGLYPLEIFFLVKFPLAFPTLLAGVRTATILNIGTATLAAFIGAGGLGEPIVTGLALNDSRLILQGAIPAAFLAIVIDGIFSLVEKLLVKNI